MSSNPPTEIHDADDIVEENEVLRAAREAREARARAAARTPQRSNKGWRTAAAAGISIGSAALIAALLYANRDKE